MSSARPRRMPGPKTQATAARPEAPWPRWRYDPRTRAIRWSAPVDFSTYADRLHDLLALHHQQGHLLSVFELAQNIFDIAPVELVRWATDDARYRNRPPQDPALKNMLDTVREVYETKLRESAEPVTSEDFLDEVVIFVPEIAIAFNWAPYSIKQREDARNAGQVFEACEHTETDDSPDSHAVPAHVPAFVTIRVPINHMNARDIEPVGEAIKAVLRDAMTNRPTKAEAPMMRPAISEYREFLFHCGEEELQRDIQRYRLYVKQGLSARQIAYLEERAKKAGLSRVWRWLWIGWVWDVDETMIAEIPTTPGPQQAERSVLDAIKRIHEALYLRPFTPTRRRRLDAPGKGIPEYD